MNHELLHLNRHHIALSIQNENGSRKGQIYSSLCLFASKETQMTKCSIMEMRKWKNGKRYLLKTACSRVTKLVAEVSISFISYIQQTTWPLMSNHPLCIINETTEIQRWQTCMLIVEGQPNICVYRSHRTRMELCMVQAQISCEVCKVQIYLCRIHG